MSLVQLPQARGPISESVIAQLRDVSTSGAARDVAPLELESGADPIKIILDDDLQLSLWLLYELHFRGIAGVDDRAEWDPELLRIRRDLEAPFEQALRRLAAEGIERAKGRTDDFEGRLVEVIEDVDGPSLSGYLHRNATAEQMSEFLIQRSLYHLKESDPAAFTAPRLDGPAKVALTELLYDEFGAGRPEMLHSTLFARALRGAGLDDQYGSYLDRVPAYTLAVNNAMSLFGLHRRLRAASMGHLAAFEATSSLPCRHISQGLERLEYGEEVRQYFDEHVEADAIHEHLAQTGICGVLVEEDPSLADDVLFGAATCVQLDRIVAEEMINAWESGGSTLRTEAVIA